MVAAGERPGSEGTCNDMESMGNASGERAARRKLTWARRKLTRSRPKLTGYSGATGCNRLWEKRERIPCQAESLQVCPISLKNSHATRGRWPLSAARSASLTTRGTASGHSQYLHSDPITLRETPEGLDDWMVRTTFGRCSYYSQLCRDFEGDTSDFGAGTSKERPLLLSFDNEP